MALWLGGAHGCPGRANYQPCRLPDSQSGANAIAVLRGDRADPIHAERLSMSITMYQASVPVFVHMLKALSGVLDKAEAHCTAKKIDPAVITGSRLIADMFPLTRQVQIACDFAKGVTARLAGVDVPSWDDTEKTIADLKARIQKTITFVEGFKAAQVDGSEGRDIAIKIAGNPVTFKGQPYLLNFGLPNFYFHTAAAYSILRANGVEIGKRDFIGAVPGM